MSAWMCLPSAEPVQSQPTSRSRLRLVVNKKPKDETRPVLWEVFSGTGVLGSVFKTDFGWDVYQIDISRDLCRKTGAVCSDVRRFDFDTWPTPTVIFLAPPCTTWSNANKREVR